MENISDFLNDLYRTSILFSILLMLIFAALIFQKKFRQIPSIYWGILSFILVVQYFFFALWEYHKIENFSVFLVIVGSLRALTIPLLYLTFNSHLKKDYLWKMPKLKFFLPAIPLYAILLPILIFTSFKNESFWVSSPLPTYYFLTGQIYIGMAFIYISSKIYLKVKRAPIIGNNPGYKGLIIKNPLIGYLKVMSFFFTVHALLIIFQLISHLVYGAISWKIADEIEQLYWFLLGLLFVYKFISYPASLFQFDLENQAIPREKYQGEMMNVKEAKLIIKKLNDYMLEEKPYLDADYSIGQLSKEVGISSRELSKVLNQYLNQNFHDYINNFRVEEFKRLIQDSENSKFSILAISMDAGFRSKSTFNTAFKKFTGITPSKYSKKVNN